jgi:selenoprotein W-related protein
VEVVLLQSSGGRFEVTVDDVLLYSKAATRRHAEPGEVIQRIREARSKQ